MDTVNMPHLHVTLRKMGPPGPAGPKGDTGEAAEMIPSVATVADLPTVVEPGWMCYVQGTGEIWSVDDETLLWVNGGYIRGADGPTGIPIIVEGTQIGNASSGIASRWLSSQDASGQNLSNLNALGMDGPAGQLPDAGPTIRLYDDGHIHELRTQDEALVLSAPGSATEGGFLLLQTGEAGQTPVDRIAIGPTGRIGLFGPDVHIQNKLGINTPAPDAPVYALDVVGDMTLNFSSGGASYRVNGVAVVTNDGSGTYVRCADNMAVTLGSASVTALHVATASGNVGLGVSGPAYKLDIAGDCNVTGSYRKNGTVVALTAEEIVERLEQDAALRDRLKALLA